MADGVDPEPESDSIAAEARSASPLEATRGGVENTLRDAMHAVVGAGILSFQRVQVARRRCERARGLDQRAAQPTEAAAAGSAQAAAGGGSPYLRLAERMAASVDRTVDALLDVVEEHLPDAPRSALAGSRAATREVRRQTAVLLGFGRGSEDSTRTEA